MNTVQLSFPLQSMSSDNIRPRVLAIGEFDGIHLGHKEVIGRAYKRSRELGIECSIMTFHPHPRHVLGINQYEKLLTPPSLKDSLLEQLGVDSMFAVDFNEAFMRMTPEQFVEQMLIPLKVNTVFVGFDFHFGHRGAGTSETLRELAQGRFDVEIVRPYIWEGEKVSSTRIRQQLELGEVRMANALLGRLYTLEGDVVHGDARGRTIGFPTANVEVTESYVIPVNGVYAVQALVKGQWLDGVMNIGVKPTFTDELKQPVLEVNLFDFNGDIYGEHVAVRLIDYIRPERRFESVQELIKQIHRDADQVRTLFARSNKV